MIIRCVCGTETTITPAGRTGYVLKEANWYDKEAKELRCPKCKSTQLPLELAGEVTGQGPITVKVVPGRSIAKKGFWG